MGIDMNFPYLMKKCYLVHTIFFLAQHGKTLSENTLVWGDTLLQFITVSKNNEEKN